MKPTETKPTEKKSSVVDTTGLIDLHGIDMTSIDVVDGIAGPLPEGKIAIVVSSYHADICDSMLAAAIVTLRTAGVTDENIPVVRTPGAWELCSGVNLAMRDPAVIGVIALGCVIRGDTSHDEHINRAVSLGLMEMSLSSELPIGFGLLTCNTVQQAIDRAGGNSTGANIGNKGHETAQAVLQLLRLNYTLTPEE